jgi:hypothetical protein
MEVYIVRVYRRTTDSPSRLVGVLEALDGETRRAFDCAEALWELLEFPGGPGGLSGGAARSAGPASPASRVRPGGRQGR